MTNDPLAVASSLSETLRRLEIAHHFGGSLASSLYGFFRTTNDLDLVVAASPAETDRWVAAVSADFLADPDPFREAARTRDSANMFHRTSLIKIDVFFSLDRPFAREEMARSRRRRISGEPELYAVLASPEDTVLHKLEWFRAGGEVSERQWNDVLGVIKVQGDSLDRAHLLHWAKEIEVEDLLARALRESGLDRG